MATATGAVAHARDASTTTPTSLRKVGLWLGFVGPGAAMIAFVGAIAATNPAAGGGAAPEIATIGLAPSRPGVLTRSRRRTASARPGRPR